MYDTIATDKIEDLRNDHQSHFKNLSNGPTPEQNEIDHEGLLDKSKIDPLEEIPRPSSILNILNSDGSYTTFGTLGNFSVITGKAKARKSFFIAILTAALISQEKIMDRFENKLPDHKSKIIYFDTEQGRYHVQLALKRICKLCDIQYPKNLEVYSFRGLSVDDRKKLIKYKVYNTENVGVVIIDGVRDITFDINDQKQACDISNDLLKWTEEMETHFITVLHQNKSDNNARGHLGTELINKAETVISVAKSDSNPDISIVEAQQCRNKEPEMFAFEIDSEGLPIPAEDFEIRTESKSKPSDLLEMEDFKKFELLNEVYSHGDSFSYSDLVIQMKMALKNRFNKKVGNNRVKELLTYCKNKKWLEQERVKAPYSLGKYQTDDQ